MFDPTEPNFQHKKNALDVAMAIETLGQTESLLERLRNAPMVVERKDGKDVQFYLCKLTSDEYNTLGTMTALVHRIVEHEFGKDIQNWTDNQTKN